MHTINIVLVDGALRVRVCRWLREGRYPVVLAEFELEAADRESELGRVERAAAAAAAECRRKRVQPL